MDEAPFAFVDLEMTGLDPKKDEIVEVCIERVVGEKIVGRVESLVRPSRLEGAGMFVHGLKSDALESAPTFAEIAEEVAKLLDGAIFVAHGADWDIKFLEAAFERLSASKEEPASEEERPPVADSLRIGSFIDTLHLTRRAFVLESHSLDRLRAHFKIDTGPAHRAGSDVAAMREVFRRVTAALAPKTPRDLWEVRVGINVARTEILEACEAAIKSEKPVKIVYRPSRRAAETIHVVLTALTKSEESAHVTGYHVASRGRVELRGERILSVTKDETAVESSRRAKR